MPALVNLQPSSSDEASLVLANRINLYIVLASTVLVVYDFILLFPAEVRYFWRGRTSLTSLLFFLNRYLWLFLAPFATWTKFANLSDEVNQCNKFSTLRQFLPLLAHSVIACVFVTRIYALYQRNGRVMAFCAIVAGMLTPLCVWAISRTPSSEPAPRVGCNVFPNEHAAQSLILSWAPVIIYDTVVFGLTLVGARRLRASLRLQVKWYVKPKSSTLVELVFHDGLVYFLVMLTSNIVNVLVLFSAPMLYKISAVHPVYNISIIMLSRLILSIRSSDENLHSDYGHIEATKPTICYLSTVNGFSGLPGERDFEEEEEV